MFNYILNKTFYGILTLFGVITVIFFLFNVLPGDPASMMLDQREDTEQLQNIRKKYGFDQPISTQYLYYLNDLSPISIHSNNPESYTFLNKDKSHKKLSFKNYLINWKINCLTGKQKKFVEEISRLFGFEN